MAYLYLLLAIISNAFANICIKLGALQIEGGVKELLLNPWQVLTNLYLFLGVFLFAVALVFYTVVLSSLRLSIAYPLMTTAGFVIVVLFSVWHLKEPFSFTHGLGLFCILLGVFILSYQLKS